VHVPSDLRESAKKIGISTGKYAVLIQAVNSGLSITEKDMQEKPVIDAITGAGGLPQQIINQAGEEKQFDVEEKKYIALADKKEVEQPEADGDDVPDQAVSIVANEDGSKPSGDNTVPDEINKERKYVEIIRSSGDPEEQRGKDAGDVGVSVAATPVETPGTTDKKPVIDPPKDTVINKVYDQETVDNYMGPDETSNSESTDSVDLNYMYKSKPNW